VAHLNLESDSLFSGFASFSLDTAVVIFPDVDVSIGLLKLDEEPTLDQVILATT